MLNLLKIVFLSENYKKYCKKYCYFSGFCAKTQLQYHQHNCSTVNHWPFLEPDQQKVDVFLLAPIFSPSTHIYLQLILEPTNVGRFGIFNQHKLVRGSKFHCMYHSNYLIFEIWVQVASGMVEPCSVLVSTFSVVYFNF